MQRIARISIGIWLMVGCMSHVLAQNVTSPYSILGIGEIDSKDFGRYFSSGNSSIARRELYAYNYANPASLTALPFKTMHFDITARGRSSGYTYPSTQTSVGIPSNDFVVKRISMAFKLNEKSGIAFGLRPYSTVNYRYLDKDVVLDGNTKYLKMVEGGGGINQVYFSLGKTIGQQFSWGLTASWLFGTLQRSTQYNSPGISLNIIKKEDDFYNGVVLQGGMQYYSKEGRKWRHAIGLTGSWSGALHGELTTEYLEGPNSLSKTVETGRHFDLPVTVGFGYSVKKKDRMTISFDASYSNWSYQKVNYTKSYTDPATRVSAGYEFAFKKGKGNYAVERGYLSAGLQIENSYIRINNNYLWDYSFSIGGGKNISKHLSLFTGLEFGKRGDNNLDQISERYTQYILGISLKDIWVGPKYARKYD